MPDVQPLLVPATPPQVTWRYDEYSDWSRVLASNYTRRELELRLSETAGELKTAAASHERAIRRTHSMTSQSAARAHGRNRVAGAWEQENALRNALEIYDFYPAHTKEGLKGCSRCVNAGRDV